MLTSFFDSNYILSTSEYCNSVELQIGRNIHKWLIDTGASVSAVKYEAVCQLNIPIIEENITINGIGGSLETLGYVYIDLCIKQQIFKHKFFVLKNLPLRTKTGI